MIVKVKSIANIILVLFCVSVAYTDSVNNKCHCRQVEVTFPCIDTNT